MINTVLILSIAFCTIALGVVANSSTSPATQFVLCLIIMGLIALAGLHQNGMEEWNDMAD